MKAIFINPTAEQMKLLGDANYIVLMEYEDGYSALASVDSLRDAAEEDANARSGMSKLTSVQIFTRLR